MWNAWGIVAAFVVVLASSPLLSGESVAQQAPSERQHRVVMHLNSGDQKVQLGALKNIRHLYQEVGRDRLQLELVVHGAGLTLFTKSATAFGQDLAQLKAEYGVLFTACSNTMKTMKIVREDLIPEVGDTAPAMVRLMERQEEGWSYIKP